MGLYGSGFFSGAVNFLFLFPKTFYESKTFRLKLTVDLILDSDGSAAVSGCDELHELVVTEVHQLSYLNSTVVVFSELSTPGCGAIRSFRSHIFLLLYST